MGNKNIFATTMEEIFRQNPNKYFFRHINEKNNFSVYLQNKINYNFVKIISHEPYIVNRQGMYFFLDEKYRNEIDSKYYKYHDIRLGYNLTDEQKYAYNFFKQQNNYAPGAKILEWVEGCWDLPNEFYNNDMNLTTEQIRDREIKIMDDLLNEVDTVILGMILHDIAFWKFFDLYWKLKDMDCHLVGRNLGEYVG